MAASKKDAEDGMKAEYSEFIEDAKDVGDEFILDEIILWED